MGVTTYTQEFTTPIPPSKMFKALIVDSHNLIPKIAPQGIKSIEFVEGDGGAGSIKVTNFAEGGHLKYLKHRIDTLDTENLFYKYTLIEGDIIFDKIESVVYEVRFLPSGDGGCVCKMTSEGHTKEAFGNFLPEALCALKGVWAIYLVFRGLFLTCLCQMQAKDKDNVELKEEDIKHGQEKAMGLYKVVEEYLLANPDVYA